MRQAKVILILSVVSALVVLGITAPLVSAKGRAIHVYPGPGAIQAAIDGASPGATIVVHEGTYQEHVVVNKADLELKAAEGETATVDGQKTGCVFTITADGVTLKSFRIIRAGLGWMDAGICVRPTGLVWEHDDFAGSEVDNVDVKYNYIRGTRFFEPGGIDTFWGIRVDWATNVVVSGNTVDIQPVLFGIMISHSQHVAVRDELNNSCIWIQWSDDVVVKNNVMSIPGHSYMQIQFSTNVVVHSGNVICGWVIIFDSEVVFRDNLIHNGYWLYAVNNPVLDIRNNHVTGYVYIEGTGDLTYLDNTVDGSETIIP